MYNSTPDEMTINEYLRLECLKIANGSPIKAKKLVRFCQKQEEAESIKLLKSKLEKVSDNTYCARVILNQHTHVLKDAMTQNKPRFLETIKKLILSEPEEDIDYYRLCQLFKEIIRDLSLYRNGKMKSSEWD